MPSGPTAPLIVQAIWLGERRNTRMAWNYSRGWPNDAWTWKQSYLAMALP